ncbi:MAG: hypothetical protein ACE5EF_00075 [Dehalococcoidia bacterium]
MAEDLNECDGCRDLAEKFRTVTETLDRVAVSIDRLDVSIRGNNQTTGLLVRIDRVEQRMKLVWGAAVTAIGAAVTAVVRTMMKGP